MTPSQAAPQAVALPFTASAGSTADPPDADGRLPGGGDRGAVVGWVTVRRCGLAQRETPALDSLRRLSRSLDTLGTGMADRPERQRTLRATVEWSFGMLGQAERSLLEVLAVFSDGWTVQAAAYVVGLDEDRN